MTDARVTQGGMLVGETSDNAPARVTQGGMLVGAQIAPPIRVTQAGMLVGFPYFPPARVTQAGTLVGEYSAGAPVRITQAGMLVGVAVERPACLTNEADLWKITRADGAMYRFTSHDRNVTYRSELYHACDSITSSAVQLSANLGETDNVDLSGLVATGAISEVDLWAGLFNGARVEIYRASWDGSAAKLVTLGFFGNLDLEDTTYKFEVTTPSELLQQKSVLETVTVSCRYRLGDALCGVALAGFTSTGTVTAESLPNLRTMAQRRIFADTSRVEALNYWQLGKLTWTTGANTGLTLDVRTSDGAVITLEQPCQYPIEAGDEYTIVKGCNKLLTTCDTTFSNAINFGGFPFVKGTDDLQATAGDDLI